MQFIARMKPKMLDDADREYLKSYKNFVADPENAKAMKVIRKHKHSLTPAVGNKGIGNLAVSAGFLLISALLAKVMYEVAVALSGPWASVVGVAFLVFCAVTVVSAIVLPFVFHGFLRNRRVKACLQERSIVGLSLHVRKRFLRAAKKHGLSDEQRQKMLAEGFSEIRYLEFYSRHLNRPLTYTNCKGVLALINQKADKVAKRLKEEQESAERSQQLEQQAEVDDANLTVRLILKAEDK